MKPENTFLNWVAVRISSLLTASTVGGWVAFFLLATEGVGQWFFGLACLFLTLGLIGYLYWLTWLTAQHAQRMNEIRSRELDATLDAMKWSKTQDRALQREWDNMSKDLTRNIRETFEKMESLITEVNTREDPEISQQLKQLIENLGETTLEKVNQWLKTAPVPTQKQNNHEHKG